MKILVVDDELVSRKKMLKIMESFGECVAAESGKEALEAMALALNNNTTFDLITLDISMPDMDGTEVLSKIRLLEEAKDFPKEKKAKVIMVTSQSDKNTIITCIKAGCDSYILKPFDRSSLSKKLKEIGLAAPEAVPEGSSLRRMVMETIQRFNQGEIKLPVLLQVSKEIETVMNDPNSGIKEVADMLEKDGVLTIKIIAASNSALFYRGGEKIKDLRTAISRIGIKETQNIVSTISSKSLYQTENKQFKELIEALWLHSLACASCCREISLKLGNRNTDKIFMLGLIHDIGCLLLLKSLGDMTSESLPINKEDLLESLQEVHTSFGAAIMKDLGLGPEIANSLAAYKWTSFKKETPQEALILNLAEKISTHLTFGFFEKSAELSGLESAKKLGLEENALLEVAELVSQGMNSLKGVFD
jgi:two-component system chemotaxis response regulator CheY